MNAQTPATHADPAPTPAGVTRYTRLFDVQILHDYYAGAQACPDFAVTPTPDCAKLMRMLGMVFKDRGTGFTVLIDQSAAGSASRYIAARLQAGAPGLTWLSFLLVPTNPGLIGLTNLPITLNPTQQNLHVSNLGASSGGVLTPDGQQPATATATAVPPTLYPVKGASVTVPTPEGATAALTDVSGAPVACATSRTGGATTFRLIGAAYGLYTVITTPASGPASEYSFIFAPSPPPSLCVLDLLLAQAPGGSSAASAFPFAATATGAMSSAPPSTGGSAPTVTVSGPQAISLTLPFTARQTFWDYYVVAQGGAGGGGGALGANLTITGAATTFTRTLQTLPNGDQAVKFTAHDPLSLRQQSPYIFALSGHRLGANGSRDTISVARLPTAPPAPVWPGPPGDPISGASEIYVYV